MIALQAVLDTLTAPFLARALADLGSRNAPLLLDADLTGQPLSDTSTTYPGAAFGYMDGQIHLGYQLAVVCLQTELYGRQWLIGQQHPGDTVSAPCLLGLVQEVERRLGCHPRRRPELLEARIAAAHASAATWEERAARYQAGVRHCLAREEQLQAQIAQAQQQIRVLHQHPASSRQSGPRGSLSGWWRQIAVWERQLGRLRRQWATLLWRAERAEQMAAVARAPIPDWQARRDALTAQNVAQPAAPRCLFRLDASFSSGANLTALLELGYDIETKAGNAAVVRALRRRVNAQTSWTRVGHNAEMVAWGNYRLHNCPYPLLVGLERFVTPQGPKHAVLLRFQADPAAPLPDLAAWFRQYNERGTIEAGIKQTKTVFHVQHPMSRRAVGMGVQIALTLFAANFVGWAEEWLRWHLLGPAEGAGAVLGGVKQLVRVLANSPAHLEECADQVVVSLDAASSWSGLVIAVGEAPAVQLAFAPYEAFFALSQ